MPAGEHALMEDSANEHTIIVNSVDYDMFFVLDAPVSRTNLIAEAAHLRRQA